ncbi:MAG TPA: hypothetical protein VGD78_20150, partial [Chthoniobacterales bacterium]
QSLDPNLELNVPGETHLASALIDLLHQALSSQYPEHPDFHPDLKVNKGNTQKVLTVVTETLRTKERRFPVEKTDRVLVRQFANPLKLGDMSETHFVIGERWKDHFHRAAAKGEGLDKIRVADLRRWIDEPEPMGLPELLQDLIILTFARQTNRSFALHGGPFQPDLGKLPDDCALKQQALPEETEWEKALEVAQAALGVPGLPSFLSGQSVALFSELVKAHLPAFQEAAPKLKTALEQRAADFGCDGQSFERLTTAQDAVRLLAAMKDRSDAALVEAMAGVDLQAPLQAIATSLKKSAELAGKVKGADLTAVNSVAGLEGEAGQKGRQLRDELFEAFRRNEYAVPFGPKFDTINHAAVQLLSSLVTTGPKPAVKPPNPQPPVIVPPPITEDVDLIARWNQSQVEGDDLPEWVPAKARKALLAVVQVMDVHAGGNVTEVVVTLNLQALVTKAGGAEVDSGDRKFRIPKYGIVRALKTDAG